MSVSYSLGALIFGIALILLTIIWPKPNHVILEDSRVSVGRRFGAFFIDSYIACFCVLPFMTLPILYLEYLATEEWVWSYARNGKPRDWFMLPISALSLIGMYKYFSWNFYRGKQTVGQKLLRFALIPTGTNANYFNRIKSQFKIMKGWMFKPLNFSTQAQDMPWDEASSIIVRRVERKS